MLQKLKERWGVGPMQVVLILCTFAIGGSLSGFLGKKIIGFIPLESGVLLTVIYIVVVTLIWPLCVLGVSIPFGQLSFFKKYLRKMADRMFGSSTAKESTF